MSGEADPDLARVQQAARPIFAALGDDNRLRLVTRPYSEGPMSIVRLSHGSGLTRQAVTKHLRVLARVGLVQSARRGRESLWTLDPRAAGYRAHIPRRNLSPVGRRPQATKGKPFWIAFLRGVQMPPVEPIEVIAERAGRHANRHLDLADVVGQVEAKWACEVAAAGRHHMLFHGPPGVGKTMLAVRVPGLLPDLDLPDALEVPAVHSLAGFNLADELITRPPDPHHSASVASIVGGGQRIAKLGAISCAHKGVLHPDEANQPSPSRTARRRPARIPSFRPTGAARSAEPGQARAGRQRRRSAP
jgi:DNA-binding transcriptional ArsR family regulator